MIDSAVTAHAMALHDDERSAISPVADPDVISNNDIREGIDMCGSNLSDNKNRHRIGFAMEGSANDDKLYRQAI